MKRALAVTRAPEPPCVALLDGGRLLAVRFSTRHLALSSAPWRGGLVETHAVVSRFVAPGELGRADDPDALLAASLGEAGLGDAIGLLTARDLTTFTTSTRRAGQLAATAVATVGLSNALTVGDPPGPLIAAVGTINLVCAVSTPLSLPALVEATALVAEARTAAVLAHPIASRRSGRPATGTGTDCTVVAAPLDGAASLDGAAPVRYVGKHTALGALLGAAAHEACARGVTRWLSEVAPV
jgi:adenosylcobinamide amidohydrolase